MFSKTIIALSTVIAVSAGAAATASAQSREVHSSASMLAYEQVSFNRARGVLSSAELHAKAMGGEPRAAELAFAQQRKPARKARLNPASARASAITARTSWPHDEFFTDPMKRRAAEY